MSGFTDIPTQCNLWVLKSCLFVCVCVGVCVLSVLYSPYNSRVFKILRIKDLVNKDVGYVAINVQSAHAFA